MYAVNSKVFIAVESVNAIFIERHTILKTEAGKEGPMYVLDNNKAYRHGELFRTKSQIIKARINYHRNMLTYYEALTKEYSQSER